jgi:hypothetical protein
MRQKTVQVTLEDLWELRLIRQEVLEDQQGQPILYTLLEKWNDLFIGGDAHDSVQQTLSTYVPPPPINSNGNPEGG